jgi:hypothetical protein
MRRYPASFELIPLHAHYAKSKRFGRVMLDGKRPLHNDWTRRNYSTRKTIESAESGNHNTGVRLTDEQLVLDIDPRNGGEEGFLSLCFNLGLNPDKWPHVITGSGGHHYYLSKPKDVLVVDTLESYPGCEFKSRGRQVVAAGSIHPETHKHYVWDFEGADIEDALPPCPRNLLNLIRRPDRVADGEGGTYSTEQIAKCLAVLDPCDFDSNDKWFPLIASVHHASGGEARQEFIDWSTSDERYRKDAYIIGRRWDSFHADKGDGYTSKTLEYHVRKAGHPELQVSSASNAADDFGDDDLPPDDDGEFESDDTTSQVNGLTIQMASDVQPVPIEWLWPDRVARGKINFVAGNPDQGKSQITLDMAARVTNGDTWPNSEGKAELGSVVILSAEDDPTDTVVPRLMAAGANLEKVAIVAATVKTDKRGRRMFNLAEDLERLTGPVQNLGDVSLLIIDPISAYMGGKGTADTYKNTEVRAVLAPLAEWAAKHRLAVVFVSHLNKNGSGRALSRLTDSLAFGALARCGWLVMPEQDATGETGRKLFLRGKNNLAADAGGLAYRIEGRTVNAGTGNISAPRIVWEGPVDITADEAMEGAGSKPTNHDVAVAFLEDFLATGPQPRKIIEEQAEIRELSWRTIERAKTTLSVTATKVGFAKSGCWMWSLPDDRDDLDFG